MELLHPVCILSIFLVREGAPHPLIIILVNPHFSLILALSLSCFVGLGNTSERDKQPVISCPEVRRSGVGECIALLIIPRTGDMCV